MSSEAPPKKKFKSGKGGKAKAAGSQNVGNFGKGRNRKHKVKVPPKPAVEIPEIVKKHPLYQLDQYLEDPLSEYNNCSIQDLFRFLQSVGCTARRSKYNSAVWNDPQVKLQNNTGIINDNKVKKEVLQRLIQNIPAPTLNKSLIAVKDYLCEKCRFSKLKVEHSKWPKYDFPSVVFMLRDEIESSFGRIPTTREDLWAALPLSGRLILYSRRNALRQKANLASVAFFKKHPELFTEAHRNIEELPEFSKPLEF